MSRARTSFTSSYRDQRSMTSSGRTVAEPTSARSRLARGSALLVMTGVLAGTVGALTAAPAEAVSGTAAGRVFRDFNMNGTFDTTSTTASPAVDVGVSGVSVRAYDKDNNLLVTAQTGATGTYSLTYNTTTATASVRLEFDTPTGMVPSRAGASGATNKTDVQFVSTGVTNADYAVAHPQDFSTSNPSFAFARQVGAIKLDGTAQNTDAGTVFTNPYGARGTTAAVPAVKEATVAQTGAVWGLTSLNDDFIFTSSLFKRHAAVGPGGLGAIYLTVPGGATDAAPFTTVANAGTNPRPAAMTTAAYFNDTTAYAQVGKIGLGGMTIAPDHSALYVVNLASKRLVRIPITINASGVPVAGTQTSVAIPAPACAGDLRPFGVSSANGSLWVTQTCAGLAAADLRGYVYKYDYTSNTFGTSAVLEIPLTGSRGFAYSPNQSATWRPWTDATGNSAWPNNVTTISIPQPMLSDVQFDANGDMTIGIKDRFGDQAGYAGSPGGGNNVYEAMGAGDSLRACLNGTASTFTLESNGSCGGRTGSGVGNTDGPGGGEFYSDDFNSGSHDQVSLGGLLQVPGFPLLINTTFDPKSPGSDPEYGTQGYRFFSNTNGSFDAATG
ncbi:MAG: Cna domain protein, partial [Nocardioides sp.]|nr:Cna domain protein [Nocardioides sp.]